MYKPWRRSAFALVARVVVILMLLGALSTPAQDESRKKLHVIALMDQSASRESAAIRHRLVGEINDKAKLTISPPVSDIGHAMQGALWAFDPATQGAIILVSNGRWHQGALQALLNAKEVEVPVFWLPVAADQSTPDIMNISAPTRARAGQRIGVSVAIRLDRSTRAELVLLMNNRPVARKEATAGGSLDFLLNVPASGAVILGAELHDPDNGTVIAELKQGALINITHAPSVLVISDTPSAFGKSLDDGGWSVLASRPQNIAARIDDLASVSLLVLDNVAATDLPPMAWNRIEHAVRRDAMGLLVLGGPNSFGLGGYRDSQLESLLPVVSEPPDDEAPVGLVFLIDVSGSMDRPGTETNRLQMAKLATTETARALRPVDRVGLITFDVQSNELLPIDARANHAAAIEKAWPQSASGGTALMPSLRRAVAALREDGAEQQLLFLLTDGFLADADLQQLDDLLQDTDVELVAMILDSGTQPRLSVLEDIAVANGGRLIRIDDVLRLPTLMRREVESRRPALVSAASKPRVVSPAAWLPHDVAWPEIEAYLLTRPREDARIHLVSARGDVLLASMTVGAGKVLVVTSGFSAWVENWLQWDRWPAFAAELTGFLALRDTSDFRMSVQQGADGDVTLSVTLPATRLPDDFRASLVGPSGRIESIDLQAWSPGELTATLGSGGSGQYTVVVEADDATRRYRFLRRQAGSQLLDEPPIAKTWVDDGLLQLWEPGVIRQLEQKPDWRNWLLGLALLLFVFILAAERLRSR